MRIVKGVSLAERLSRLGREKLWNERPHCAIDTVVLHYISAIDFSPLAPFDLDEILAVFCDKVVSTHFLIQRDGEVFQLVPEEARAWHAGGSIMPAPDFRRDVNNFSFGIELVATAESGYTDLQYESLVSLCRQLQGIRLSKLVYVGHEAIAGLEALRLGLRHDRKVDPGDMFDWGRFFSLLGNS